MRFILLSSNIVSYYLDRFQDKLSINIVNSQIQTVYLSAVGTGTTIITEPSFGPVYTIGPYFSNHTFQQKFRFYNKGRRPQQIYWLTEGFALSKTRRKQEYNAEDMKYRVIYCLLTYFSIFKLQFLNSLMFNIFQIGVLFKYF